MTGATITRKMSYALNEKDVENLYREYFSGKFKDIVFSSPYGCDGFGVSEKNKIRVLCEFKEDLDLQNRYSQCKVLSQAIYYIKKFELDGEILPSTILIADKNEWFVIHTNDVFDYLSMDYDWSIPPSQAHTNSELMSGLMSDDKIRPFVGEIISIEDSLSKIKDLSLNIKRLVSITQHNILNVFDRFDKKVVVSKELSTNDCANLFIQLLINPVDNYLHPHKTRKKIVTKSFGEVSVQDREKFESFFSHFSNKYTPKQKEVLTSILDRLIEDVTRRKQGEFFTPTIWVDKSYEYIASVFGNDWREKYVVWDPAWGTGNLTRDYKFKELYCSTLHQSDIDTANQMGYNPEGVKFQFDFLNDPYEKLPESLRKIIEQGREIIVLMNPPYGKATPINELLKKVKNSSEGMSKTIIGLEMNNLKMGISSSNLYMQFLFKSLKFNNLKICVFSPPGFLSSGSNKKFRSIFLNKFKFINGFIMDSSHFADVKSWGLSFSIFDNQKNTLNDNYNFDVLDINENFEIKKIKEKVIYNADNNSDLSSWMEKEKYKNNFEYPVFESVFGISETKKLGFDAAIGYINNHSNNVQQQNVIHLMSGVCKANGNKPITKDNFYRMVSGYTARKIIKRNWLDDKDEFIEPDVENENFTQFQIDSIVYSIFHIHSFQSSLRQVTYKEKLWDIKNEFFWMSKEEMLNLAETNHYDNLYNDARTSEDRYVHKLLFGEQNIYNQLSPDAKEVLDTATNLVRISIQQRKLMSEGFPEYHLNSWDAGYAQLKLVWKEYLPNEFKEFRHKYKRFEDRMRPLVYELGFLLK